MLFIYQSTPTTNSKINENQSNNNYRRPLYDLVRNICLFINYLLTFWLFLLIYMKITPLVFFFEFLFRLVFVFYFLEIDIFFGFLDITQFSLSLEIIALLRFSSLEISFFFDFLEYIVLYLLSLETSGFYIGSFLK